ncbi:uncharacterized protein Z519_02737 [Cladophialophora bantiana CBS 173.52]|uniref:Uncharacterized protein n=1 Tax=Cladophialophora bantiana (strain ATCC 10958 / CBS 173.52 / CDC B-1940 / NIH 8579) TaxID=1442370 RepID=A0A0D2I2A7_CLAB1|nr:uncharacterized protein Z519_02737 [Cladophialophora bantiana CBS 173.52]KIW97345.1 hypothetical protein Z519_02737 [Cladophialophora bantiana CBS 173.52]
MVFLVLATGAAIYFTVEKVRDHKKKKRALRAQEASRHGLVETVSNIDENTARRSMEDLPPYILREPPPYQIRDQHRELKENK